MNAHVRVMRGSVRVFVCAARDGGLVNAIVGLEQGLKERELHRTQPCPLRKERRYHGRSGEAV